MKLISILLLLWNTTVIGNSCEICVCVCFLWKLFFFTKPIFWESYLWAWTMKSPAIMMSLTLSTTGFGFRSSSFKPGIISILSAPITWLPRDNCKSNKNFTLLRKTKAEKAKIHYSIMYTKKTFPHIAKSNSISCKLFLFVIKNFVIYFIINYQNKIQV